MESKKKLLNILSEAEASPEKNPYEEPLYPSGKIAASIEPVSYEQMPPALQRLMDEHAACLEIVKEFDAALSDFKQSDWELSKNAQDAFRNFFLFFDKNISRHQTREEKLLFPCMHAHLISAGEHSTDGHFRISAIEVLEEDHFQITQGATVVFNFLGLAPRLPNWESSVAVFEHAYELGKELVENLRLHMMREEDTLFPLACKYLSVSELEELAQGLGATS